MAERLSGYFGTDPREADAFLPFRRRRLRHGLTQPPQQLRNTQGRPRRIAIPRNPTGDLGRLKPALLLDHPRIHAHQFPSRRATSAIIARTTAQITTPTKSPEASSSGSGCIPGRSNGRTFGPNGSRSPAGSLQCPPDISTPLFDLDTRPPRKSARIDPGGRAEPRDDWGRPDPRNPQRASTALKRRPVSRTVPCWDPGRTKNGPRRSQQPETAGSADLGPDPRHKDAMEGPRSPVCPGPATHSTPGNRPARAGSAPPPRTHAGNSRQIDPAKLFAVAWKLFTATRGRQPQPHQERPK